MAPPPSSAANFHGFAYVASQRALNDGTERFSKFIGDAVAKVNNYQHYPVERGGSGKCGKHWDVNINAMERPFLSLREGSLNATILSNSAVEVQGVCVVDVDMRMRDVYGAYTWCLKIFGHVIVSHTVHVCSNEPLRMQADGVPFTITVDVKYDAAVGGLNLTVAEPSTPFPPPKLTGCDMGQGWFVELMVQWFTGSSVECIIQQQLQQDIQDYLNGQAGFFKELLNETQYMSRL